MEIILKSWLAFRFRSMDYCEATNYPKLNTTLNIIQLILYSSILSSRCLLIRLRKLELRQKFDLTRAIVALILLLQGDKYSLLKTTKMSSRWTRYYPIWPISNTVKSSIWSHNNELCMFTENKWKIPPEMEVAQCYKLLGLCLQCLNCSYCFHGLHCLHCL